VDIGTVVTLVTSQGEIIGRLEAYDDHYITLSRPRISSELAVIDEAVAEHFFASGISVTGEKCPESLSFSVSMVLAITATEKSFAEKWAATAHDWII
jgi:hypothetical protein